VRELTFLVWKVFEDSALQNTMGIIRFSLAIRYSVSHVKDVLPNQTLLECGEPIIFDARRRQETASRQRSILILRARLTCSHSPLFAEFQDWTFHSSSRSFHGHW